MPKDRRLSVPLMLEWVFLRAGCVRGNGLRNEPDAEMWPGFCSSYVEICHIKNVADARREAQKAFLEHCKNRGFEWTKSDLEEAELPEAEDGKCLKCGKEKPKRTDLLSRYDEEPIMSNLGPVLEAWPPGAEHAIVLPGVGRKRRRRILSANEWSCWGKSKALYGAFCSAHCSKGRCRSCAEVLVKDDRDRCTECKEYQLREWYRVPYLGGGVDGEIEYVSRSHYFALKRGEPIPWPRCPTNSVFRDSKNLCILHPCRHICTRDCDHVCSSVECRFVPLRPGDDGPAPFGYGDCKCPPEWIEAFDFSKQFE